MKVHQISIFIENRSGTLVKVLDILKMAGIQLIATTISDTEEYGIYRIICSEPIRALETLKSNGVAAEVSEVFAVTLDNYPGRAADAIRLISDAGICITYLYSFLLDGKGILVFKTDSPEQTEAVIEKEALTAINDDSLLSLV